MRKFTTLFLVVLFGLHWSSNAQTYTFTCPTTTTTWIVPAGATSILVDVIGATGRRNSVDAVPTGAGPYTLIHRPGNGARVQATLAVTPGQVLNIYVGGTPLPSVSGSVNVGGFNGGGNSSFAPTAGGTPNISGGGGGGASDIRIGGVALANRVVVAGGGGGAGGNYFTPPGLAPVGAVINTDRGGDGGGVTGENGSTGPSPGIIGGGGTGLGGTAGAGGAGGVLAGWPAATAGVLGIGGDAATTTGGAGGGGGYYGGGGSTWEGAGGGSSYTDAVLATAVTHTRGYNSTGCGTVIITLICSIPTVSGVTNVCVGSTTTLSSPTVGGTWTSATSSVATVNPSSGVVRGVTAGTSMITYTVPGGCFTTTLVTVSALPNAGSISGTTTVCPAATTQLSDGAAGGVWSSVTSTVATITAGGLVTGVSAGTSVISYTVTNICGTAVATTTVTVNPSPNAGSISGVTAVCPGATSQLSDPAPGGVWSSVTPSVATITAGGLVTGVGAGTSIISYTVTNSCGTVAATTLVTVSPPNAGTISGTSSVCPGATTQLTDPAVGGVWSSVSPGVATVDATGLVTGVSSGTSIISYAVTNSCGTIAATILVTVYATTAGTITGTTSICPGATTLLNDAVAGGVWSSGTSSVATISATGLVTGVSAGTSVISYAVTNICGTVTATTVVIVNPLPVAGTITGSTIVCVGSTTTLSNSVAGGVWTSVPTSFATITASGVVTGVAVGNSTISYSVTNSCGTAVTTHNIAVRSPGSAGTIVGGTKVCVGDTLQLSNAITGGQWGSTATGMVDVDIVTGEVVGLSAGVAGISYLIPHCGFAITSLNITVYALPPMPVIVVTGATLSTTLSYAGYQWFLGGSAIPGATNATHKAMANGIYSVTVKNIGGCDSSSAGKVVTNIPVGVSNVNERSADIKIYPNPASTQLMISASEKIDISIMGIDGKMLITQKDATQTDVSKLVPGMYIIRIYDQDGLLIKVANFVKE